MGESILRMSLKEQWFNMILFGIKKEEYREIKKHWNSHLLLNCDSFKEFSIVRFTHGYGAEKPSFDIECKDIRIGEGTPEWGAVVGKKYFIIELGEILNRRNL